jgi:hypothetical protein
VTWTVGGGSGGFEEFAGVDFFAIDNHMFRRRNAELYLVAFDTQDGDDNIIANVQGFVRPAGQDEHDFNSALRIPSGCDGSAALERCPDRQKCWPQALGGGDEVTLHLDLGQAERAHDVRRRHLVYLAQGEHASH